MKDDEERRFNVKPWIKFYTEAWLTGTTRQEFNSRQRSVFVDFLSLAKRKDGIVEIPNRKRLAGMLGITPKLLNEVIEICLRTDKFLKISTSAKEAFRVNSWDNYQGKSKKSGFDDSEN
jgi:hypothetical protein